ncbi:MAG: hypothetical protein V4488_05850 [Pseudomonadota bacterium]
MEYTFSVHQNNPYLSDDENHRLQEDFPSLLAHYMDEGDPVTFKPGIVLTVTAPNVATATEVVAKLLRKINESAPAKDLRFVKVV